MNHENRFEFFNLVDRLFILENVWINKELVKVYLFVCKHAWVVFDNVLPTKQQTLMFCLSGGRHYHHHQRQLTAVGKCFLLCFQSACALPAPIQLHFPNVSFLQREGEKVRRENKIIVSPFFSRLGKENKINLYFCLLFRFGLCVFPFFTPFFY